MSDESQQRQQAKRSIVAAALAEGRSYGEAARLAGVGVRTIGRWRNDPDFDAEVANLREERVALLIGQLTGLFTDALDELRELLDESDPILRLKAIALTGDMLARLRRDPQLEHRVRKLEAEKGSVL